MATKKAKKAAKGALPDVFTETIIDLDATEALDADYGDYAKEVIDDRAVPRAADGLKPVHRRILWDMWVQRLLPDRPFVKTARVVGDTMALFHPHGDASIADALARLAQPFSNLVPLLDFHGNYGSPDFSPAAARYTETRLGWAGMLLLGDIDQGTVPMVENYEGSTEEPLVLPAEFPHALINGSNGIAVGLSSYLPPHHPAEVIAAAQHLIANPGASVDDLMHFIQGPSFPSPCTVVNGADLVDAYRSGVGRVVVRGKWEVEQLDRGKQQLVITSLPYDDTRTGSAETFMEKLLDAVDSGDIGGVVTPNDESSDGKTRITIGLANGVPADAVIPALLKYTNLQVTNKVQMHFIDSDGRVRLYNLRTLLMEWVNHRIAVITRRSQNRLAKIDDRLHRLRGFLAVLVDIDRAIQIVRTSKSRAVARPALMAAFEIDDDQANAVLDLNLGQLTEDAVIEFQRETEELIKEEKALHRLLGSQKLLRTKVGTELAAIAEQFDHVERVTEITTIETPKPSKAAFVLDEPVTVTLTGDGYLQSFKASSKAKQKGVVVRTFDTTTTKNLVAISSTGKLFRALAAAVPGDKPTAPVNIFPGLEPGDPIIGWWTDTTLPAELLLVTSDGQIKRIASDDLAGGDRRGGIAIMKIDDGASLIAAVRVAGEKAAGKATDVLFADDSSAGPPILLATRNGYTIRFPLDIRPMGRTAAGVRGIKLTGNDRVIGALVAHDRADLVILHNSGSAKRIEGNQFPLQRRAGVGLRGTVVTGKHGPVSLIAPAGNTMARVGEEWQQVDLGLGIATGTREAAPAKIRSFDGIITALG
jgi:DNA gyrase subunit A